ncbi:DUF4328 domain-containing protein [Kitasatospora nipponensis]|uniref:DUF4328 domain-containing protein n=1 Tax=Kitasatospora nipponensis TaxID=258049 RepID=UPI0031CF3A61
MATESRRCFGCAQAAPGWPAAYRSANGRSVAVLVLLGLSALLSAAAVVIDLWSNALYGGVLDGADDISHDEIDALDALAHGLNTISILTTVATAVAFIVWFYRVRQNADLLAPNGHRLGRGWTIGAWFTPFVALWFPWQLMADCWQASAPLDADGRRRTLSQKVLVLWWSTWIGWLILGRIAGAMLKSVDMSTYDRMNNLRSVVLVEAAGSTLRLVAAVAAIVVVHRLTAMQQARRSAIDPIAAMTARAVVGQGAVPPVVVAQSVAPAPAPAPAEVPRDATPQGQLPHDNG